MKLSHVQAAVCVGLMMLSGFEQGIAQQAQPAQQAATPAPAQAQSTQTAGTPPGTTAPISNSN